MRGRLRGGDSRRRRPLLDVNADAAHNRSVYTFAGDAATARAAAALALFDAALAAIDLRHHPGEHPRIGAVDVVPFVPLGDATMADCVALARAVGATSLNGIGLPVYLYEEAAASPERRRLEDIRRGGFDGLAAKMARADWRPDFGPPAPHPSAGATVIGARIAAHRLQRQPRHRRVWTSRKTIARAVRQSSGGLPFVKAMGVALADRGIVQVSMNLTNFEKTLDRERL